MKLLGFLALLGTLVLGPLPSWTQLGAFTLLFAGVGLLVGCHWRGFLPRLLLLSPLFLGLLLSALFQRGAEGSPGSDVFGTGPLLMLLQGETGRIIARICLALLLAHILATSMTLHQFARALASLRVPQSTTTSALLTLRYFGMLRREAATIRKAMTARGYRPRWAGQAKLLGSLVAALFFRSLARGERVHRAMLARGYGESGGHSPVRAGTAPLELLFALLLLLPGLLILVLLP